ncbi:hypothetical protein [Nocardia sp. CDC160]|uniref:hypothetical protein n=1 Tax=Nocardia sp. CDC160 TaxID=3112166 RepID=UPI002DBDC99B|nr:hypothetical protein [Nocardia sp. CDC160]MEC3919321.1 hypothetical protein [Nocardia sp. CDC160]
MNTPEMPAAERATQMYEALELLYARETARSVFPQGEDMTASDAEDLTDDLDLAVEIDAAEAGLMKFLLEHQSELDKDPRWGYVYCSYAVLVGHPPEVLACRTLADCFDATREHLQTHPTPPTETALHVEIQFVATQSTILRVCGTPSLVDKALHQSQHEHLAAVATVIARNLLQQRETGDSTAPTATPRDRSCLPTTCDPAIPVIVRWALAEATRTNEPNPWDLQAGVAGMHVGGIRHLMRFPHLLETADQCRYPTARHNLAAIEELVTIHVHRHQRAETRTDGTELTAGTSNASQIRRLISSAQDPTGAPYPGLPPTPEHPGTPEGPDLSSDPGIEI